MPLSKIQDIGNQVIPNLGRRNLLVNGAMQIRQRHSGSYSQINSKYSFDRFRGNSFDGGATTGKFTVQQSTTAPDDFAYSLLVTSAAATSDASNNIFNIEQLIEGYNTKQLNYGTSAAKTITLSFFVRSSLTGTFGGALKNNARNRNYPFTYTISSANTFERKEITITGDTTGTWDQVTNGTGLWVSFGLGVGSNYSGSAGAWGAGDYFSATGATSVVGTNGATWYITGVQLEVGSSATDFEHRSFGEEFALCQRYFQEYGRGGSNEGVLVGMIRNTHFTSGIRFQTQMRASPTITAYGGNSTTGAVQVVFGGAVDATHNANSSDVVEEFINNDGFRFRVLSTSGGTNGDGAYIDLGTDTNQLSFDLESEL